MLSSVRPRTATTRSTSGRKNFKARKRVFTAMPAVPAGIGQSHSVMTSGLADSLFATAISDGRSKSGWGPKERHFYCSAFPASWAWLQGRVELPRGSVYPLRTSCRPLSRYHTLANSLSAASPSVSLSCMSGARLLVGVTTRDFVMTHVILARIRHSRSSPTRNRASRESLRMILLP